MSLFDDLQEFYLDQPAEVSLESIALCNAACTFCPYPTLERKGEKMSDELLDRILGQLAEFEVPFYFSPFKVNEPLLDPRFIDICRRIPETALLRIFTNGSPLTQRRIDEIASLPRVAHLWVSLNEYRPEEYKALMGLDFDKTARRLDALHEQDFPHPVVLSTVGTPNGEFIAYCTDRWPDFEAIAIEHSGWLGYTEPQRQTVPDMPCGRWFEMSIMADGVVSLCCMDGQGEFPLGDLNQQTLLEVYNSPAWRDRRERLVSRLEIHPCSTCTY